MWRPTGICSLRRIIPNGCRRTPSHVGTDVFFNLLKSSGHRPQVDHPAIGLISLFLREQHLAPKLFRLSLFTHVETK